MVPYSLEMFHGIEEAGAILGRMKEVADDDIVRVEELLQACDAVATLEESSRRESSAPPSIALPGVKTFSRGAVDVAHEPS